MITNLKLTNFQGHKDSDIDLSSPVVFIKGPNNANKSGIYWALNTALYGEDFSFEDDVKWGEREARIVVTLDNGKSIERYRTKSINTCTLLEDSKQVAQYSTIRSTQKLIQDFSGFIEVDNKTPQMIKLESDQFYMVIGVSDASRLKWTQNLVGGSLLQESKGKLESDLRALNTSLTKKVQEADRLKETLAIYEGIGLNDLLELQKQCEMRLQKVNEWKEQVSKVRAIKSVTIPELFDYTRVVKLISAHKKIVEKKRMLENTLTTLEKYFQDLDKLKELQEAQKNIFSALEEHKCPTCGGYV